MRRVPFSERLWRPEEYLGPKDLVARDSLVLAVDRIERERQLGIRLRPADAKEFKVGYIRKVYDKIVGEQAEEQMRPVVRMDRAMGDRR